MFTLKIEAAWNSKTPVSYHITRQCHNPDNPDMNHHCESLTTSYLVKTTAYLESGSIHTFSGGPSGMRTQKTPHKNNSTNLLPSSSSSCDSADGGKD
jgi:hypothetical protein